MNLRAVLGLAAAGALAAGAGAQPFARQPILDFQLPVFSPSNHRVWFLTSNEALMEDRNRYTFTGVHLEMYSDDEANVLQAVLETPAATGDVAARRVTGPDLLHVHLFSPDVDIHGADWSFEDRLPAAPGEPHDRVFTLRRDVVVNYAGDIGAPLRAHPPAAAAGPATTIIEADAAETHDTSAEVHLVFTGNVRLTGSSLKLTCARLEVWGSREAQDPEAAAAAADRGGIRRVLATGDVVLNQGGRSATAARADLSVVDETVVLEGAPATLTDVAEGLTVEGARIALDRRAGTARVREVRLIGPTLPNFGPPTPENTVAPTVITAHQLDAAWTEAGGNFVFTDDVRLTGTNLAVGCDRLELQSERTTAPPPAGGPAPDPRDRLVRVLASGHVTLAQAGRTATCGRAEIRPPAGVAVLTENPLLSDVTLGMTLEGSRMTFQRADNLAVVENPVVRGPALPDLGVPADGAPTAGEPTIIMADRLMMTNTGVAGHYVFQGNVRLTGTNLALTCARLELFAEPAAAPPAPAAPGTDRGGIRRILASGGVTVHQRERDATSGEAEALPGEDMLILTGNPSVVDRATGETSRGRRAVFRRGDRHVEIEGADLSGRLPGGATENPPGPAPTTP